MQSLCRVALLLLALGTTTAAQNTNPGSIVAWGDNGAGQCSVPALPAGLTYTQVVGGNNHSLALRSDGSVVAWGLNSYGQTTVPTLPTGLSYTQVSGGGAHSLALRSDGSVVAWGLNSYGQTAVPALTAGLSYIQISGGGTHSLALRSDGSLVAWGSNSNGQSGVPALPVGLSYTQVASGATHSLALRSDGAVLAWGSNANGQTSVPTLPVGLSYTRAAGGGAHSLALRSNGSVVAWGYGGYGLLSVPALPVGFIYTQVAAGNSHSLALVGAALSITTVATAPVGTPLLYALSTNTALPLVPFLMDVSFNGAAPGISVPLPLGATGIIPLNPPFLFSEYGQALPSLFTGFIGTLDAAGQATAALNTPNYAPLIGLTLYAAAVTNDPAGPFGIGRVSNAVSTIFTTPTPVIASVAPAIGGTNGGNVVTINGSSFVAGAAVSFGGAAATNVAVLSATQISCIVPARPTGPVGSVSVTVTNNGGVVGTLANAYTYQWSYAAPTLTAVLPGSGDVAGGMPVIISGSGFVLGATVSFAGAAATQVFVISPTALVCLTPTGLVGPANVLVTNVDSQSVTLTAGFIYIYPNPAPTVGAALPNDGPIAGGAPLSISGTGFLAGATVSIGGVVATQVAVVSATSITCLTPARPLGSASIVVTNFDTQFGTLANGFSYIANLSLASVSPLSAIPGTPITLTGAGFQAGVALLVGGVSVTPTSVSLTQIVFPMPLGTSCATVLNVTNSSTQSANIAFNPAPTITSVAYGTGPVTGGNLFFILGTNFHPGTTVTVGGATATIQSLSITSIFATAPPGTLGPAALVVTSPSACSASAIYTYQ